MTARLEERGDRLIVWNGNADKKGALSPELYAVVLEAFEKAEAPNIRSVILTSEGDFFCAGGNLNILIERRNLSEGERAAKVDELHDIIRAIRSSPVPVVAAVKGGAAGAGASLALACDVILAEPGSKFTASYVRAGLVPDGGLTASLARLVPRSLAMRMCLLAEPIPSETMASLGVIADITEDPVGASMQLADRIAQGPRQAMMDIRATIWAAYETTFSDQLDRERDAMARASGGDEAAEGIAAFLEKRRPSF